MNGPKGPAPGGRADPLDAVSLLADDQEINQNRPTRQACISRNPAAVAAMRRELNLEFLHECAGGIRVHAALIQTFAEIGDVAGTCYALKRLFAHAKAAHPVYVELRDEPHEGAP
jgi:hypothetical protein